jgi:hypothetical protein
MIIFARAVEQQSETEKNWPDFYANRTLTRDFEIKLTFLHQHLGYFLFVRFILVRILGPSFFFAPPPKSWMPLKI